MKTEEECVEFVNMVTEQVIKPMIKDNEDRDISAIIKESRRASMEFHKLREELAVSHPEIIEEMIKFLAVEEDRFEHPADEQEHAVEVLAMNLFIMNHLFMHVKTNNTDVRTCNLEKFKTRTLMDCGWYEKEDLREIYKEKARKELGYV